MAQYQVTEIIELLHPLFQKNINDPGVANFLESIRNQILQAQATEQLEAEYDERTDTRKWYRNGNSPHPLFTRVGSITVKGPSSSQWRLLY